MAASEKIWVFPVILTGIPVAQAGLLLWHDRVLVCSVSVERVQLFLCTLGTVQGASTDSGGAWSPTSSNRLIVWIHISVSANTLHAIYFPHRRRLNRRLIVFGVAIPANTMMTRAKSVVIVKGGVMGGGSSFRGGERSILVELFCTPTTDYRSNNKYQYCESNEPNYGKGTGDSSGVFKETFAGVGIDNSGGSGGRSDNGSNDYRVAIRNGKER